tara:strand:+ start:515 stop:637 length:123 start_codon:yes stop_codon:yes gene_type:complete
MSADEITTYWSLVNITDLSPVVSQITNSNTADGSTVEKRI